MYSPFEEVWLVLFSACVRLCVCVCICVYVSVYLCICVSVCPRAADRLPSASWFTLESPVEFSQALILLLLQLLTSCASEAPRQGSRRSATSGTDTAWCPDACLGGCLPYLRRGQCP